MVVDYEHPQWQNRLMPSRTSLNFLVRRNPISVKWRFYEYQRFPILDRRKAKKARSVSFRSESRQTKIARALSIRKLRPWRLYNPTVPGQNGRLKGRKSQSLFLSTLRELGWWCPFGFSLMDCNIVDGMMDKVIDIYRFMFDIDNCIMKHSVY